MNSKPIPMLDLKAQYSTIKIEIQSAIERVLDSQQFILGTEVDALERLLADYCQCKFAFGVSSGTDALLISLMAIGINPGDEVIILAPYWVSYYDQIIIAGGKPIVVEAKLESDFKVSPEQIESAITDRTRLIIFNWAFVK